MVWSAWDRQARCATVRSNKDGKCIFQSNDCNTWVIILILVSILGRVKRFFSSPKRPGRLWIPPSLLLSGYWVPFRERGVKLTI
jgi:hypothetical protein